MRKTTLVAALGLALSMGAGAVAAQSTTPAPRDRGAYGQDERGERGRRGPDQARGRRGPEAFLLKGITLSADQQKRVDALRQEQAQKSEASRDEFRKSMQEARAARERGDSATAQRIFEQNRQRMTQMRDQRIASLRSILTADQRKQFDANVAEMKQRAEKREAERGGRHGGPGRGWHGGRN